MADAPIFGTPETLVLPFSKAKVKVRQPSIVSILAAGGFPNELTTLVWSMYQQTFDPEQMVHDPESLKQMAVLVDTFVPYVLVQPKVITSGDTQLAVDPEGYTVGVVSIYDLPDLDKQFLFLYAQGLRRADGSQAEEAKLSNFRDESEGTAAAPGSGDVRAEAVDADRAPAGEPVGA